MSRYIRNRFVEMNRLYHFTSFDSACKIIQTRRLKFGKLSQMNDLIESNKIVFQRVYLDNLDEDKENGLYAEEEMRRYQLISFSQDRTIGDSSYEGFNLHPMWGLYAGKGYGVCLVFDKDKLILDNGDYARDVDYSDDVLPDYAFRNSSKPGIRREIWRRRDEIYFRKRKEWENEQEYRVIRRAKEERETNYLDVSEALAFVILCKDDSLSDGEPIWWGLQYQELKRLDRKLPKLSYQFGIDGYELWRDVEDYPFWTEFGGFEL